MATRQTRTAQSAAAAEAKIEALRRQQEQLAAELRKQQKLAADRRKALLDTEQRELGKLVQAAGLNRDQLAALLATARDQVAEAPAAAEPADSEPEPAEPVPAPAAPPPTYGFRPSFSA